MFNRRRVTASRHSTLGVSLSELVDFCDAQLADSMICPETKMPVTDQEMLKLAPIIFACGVVAKLAGMLCELKKQSKHLFLLGPRQANQR